MYARTGQGLLETTIAIGVIVVGLFAALTLTFANVRASEVTSLRFTATQLAREGIEVVRAIRDGNWLAGDRSWDARLVGFANDGTAIAVFTPLTGWRLDFSPQDLADASARVIRRQVDGGTFLLQGSAEAGDVETPHRRLLVLDSICRSGTIIVSPGSCDPANDPKVGIRVQSTVRWTSVGRSGEIIAEERLYDWR